MLQKAVRRGRPRFCSFASEKVPTLPGRLQRRPELKFFLAQGNLNDRAQERLAFRELGLSIGLHAVLRMYALLHEATTLDVGGATDTPLDYLLLAASGQQTMRELESTRRHQHGNIGDQPDAWRIFGFAVGSVCRATTLCPTTLAAPMTQDNRPGSAQCIVDVAVSHHEVQDARN